MLDRKLGVHTSIANGIHLSLDRAKKLSCNTVQIFSHNPRQWRVDPLPSDSIMRFKEKRKTYVINPVFIHASYLRNLASVNKKILEKSIRSISYCSTVLLRCCSDITLDFLRSLPQGRSINYYIGGK